MSTSNSGAADAHLMTRSLAIIVLALLAIGCAREIVAYPPHWAPINTRSDCYAVEGTYEEKGERAYDGPRGGFLRFTHLATYNEVDFRGPHVTLSFPEPGVFLIQAGGERRFHFEKGEAACDSGHLELRRSYHGPTMAGPAWSYETVALTRSIDGWLIAKWERTEWLLLGFFIPTYSLIREWYRFGSVPRAK